MNSDFSKLISRSSCATAFMKDEITKICCELPKRSPGSEGEYRAAEYMADTLKTRCGCVVPIIESFKEHPDSFYGYCRISGIIDSLACIGFFVHPAVSLASGCISLFLFLFFFVFYLPVIDWLFPEREGTNVTSVRPCSGEVKRRVFFNGHVDAAWEFTLNYHFGGIIFEIPNVMALIGVVFYLVLSVCSLSGAGKWTQTAALWGILFLPFFIAVFFTYNPRIVVDGANDNLSGCYMGISLLHEMEENGMNLENTEIGVILTGSEEAGLRGAKAWSKKHQSDYRDVPTYIISFDTIHDPNFLMVNERDLNGTVKSDAALAELFLKAAVNADVTCSKGAVPLFGGATDSAAFTQGGFRSIGVTGLNHKLEDYYHTRRDTWDNINDVGLENCYKATVRMLELLDSGVLDQPPKEL